MKKLARLNRRARKMIFTAMCGAFPFVGLGCMDSDIAKRFREAWGPGVVQGLSNAITNPAQSQIGFRQTATALFDGLGAIIQPRTPLGGSSSSGGGSSSSSSSSSGS